MCVCVIGFHSSSVVSRETTIRVSAGQCVGREQTNGRPQVLLKGRCRAQLAANELLTTPKVTHAFTTSCSGSIENGDERNCAVREALRKIKTPVL